MINRRALLTAGVALGALREQDLHGPCLRVEPQPEAEQVTFLGSGDGRLGLVDLQAQAPFDEPAHAGHHPQPRPLAAHIDREESRRGESHPPALAEPDLNVSAHPAPIVQPHGRTPKRQWANSPGWRRATSARNLRARARWRNSRLYFQAAHRTRISLRWRKVGNNMDL